VAFFSESAALVTGYDHSILRLQAFKYELMLTGEQQRAMRRFAGSCRFVYNTLNGWGV
jgi:hypothetical protein